MMSRQRLVAVVCLATVLLLAASPFGIGVAVLPLFVSLATAERCPDLPPRPATPPSRAGVVPLLPSRAPPFA